MSGVDESNGVRRYHEETTPIMGSGDNDRLVGGPGDDHIEGRGGADMLNGGAGDDVLEGGRGRDILRGGAGDDVLIGGVGRDHLTGGAGADQFLVAGDGKMDLVTDFDLLEGDRINAVGFKLLGLHVDLGLGVTTALFDQNDDGIADASIRVKGLLTLAGIIFGPPAAPLHGQVAAGAFEHGTAATHVVTLPDISAHHLPDAHLAIA